jgi:hypothetical protein
MNRDYPLSPTPNPQDSIGVYKSKAAAFAKKDFARKDFAKKESSLTDSAEKYTNKVFNAASTMSKEQLAKNNISKKITSKADTIYNFFQNGMSFRQERPNKKK